ncbi:MAG: hypothetical protein C4B58_15460 [Deltaproteobacteria bacterium]|nr:MAG: hypothetical protein C4B58_15460 [Deltaproteobacteria bacterium]
MIYGLFLKVTSVKKCWRQHRKLNCRKARQNFWDAVLVEFIDQVCEKKGINPKELRMGSRRACISQVRLQIAYQLVQDYGILLTEVGRQLGVSTSAISKAITRRTKE